MPTTRALLLACLAISVFAAPVQAGIEIDCNRSLASYRLTHPNLDCRCSSANSMPTCSSGSASSRSVRGKYASAKASLAAGVFGAVLESVLFDAGPSEADKERARQQADAERKRAEAERLAAIERTREAEQRHRNLLGSLSSLPGAAPAGSSATSGGVRLTALEAASTLPSNVKPSLQDFSGMPGFATDEAAREWLAGPESLFMSVWKPLPVAPQLPAVPMTQPSCTNPALGCEITLPTTPNVAIIRASKVPPSVPAPPAEPEALRGTVALLRPSSCIAPCDDEPYYLRAWGAASLPPEQVRSATLVTLVDRLKKTGKVLVESAAMIALDAVPNSNLASGVKIVYNVGEAADTVLKDSLKVAGYVGTRHTLPPELIPFEETAAPFAGDPEDLRKFVSGSRGANKGLSTLVVESAWLAQKLRRVWVAQQ